MKNKVKEIISKIALDNCITLSSDEVEDMASKYIEQCGDPFPSVDLQEWRIEEFLADFNENYTYITTMRFKKTKWDRYWLEMEYVVCKEK